MPKINLLPKNVAELIAAGEVVERPASVIKELVENSIDAGATVITVEINRGGITYMRVTDNGCGIDYSDVPTAFLRHATSKISKGDDLDSIGTLGFRGEALAAVSSVAKVEMLTATENSEFGTHYVIEGGEEVLYEESGCPKGTTIIIRDIFYNTPARMKFLKKDVSEANSCAAVIDRIALSHPEISFKFIRDGKQTLVTTGDNNIKSVIYSVLGREFSNSLIPVDTSGIVSVKGMTCKPVSCRPTRNNQFTFINGRLVRSGTVIAAVEQAYKNSAMVGKFPGFVLYLTVPFDTVDVNVHPAKTEVRFSDEKMIFDSVYSAVKNAINMGDTRPEIKISKPAFNPFQNVTAEEFKQTVIKEKTIAEEIYDQNFNSYKPKTPVLRNDQKPDFINIYTEVKADGTESKPIEHLETKTEVSIVKEEYKPQTKTVSVDIIREEDEIIIIGQAFNTYIIAQKGDSIFMIDKHAAHERILFNSLKSNTEIAVQQLLTPITVILQGEEYDAITNNFSLLEKSGFEVDDFGNSTVLVRAIPSFLTSEDISSLMSEIAENILKTGQITSDREDNLFHTVACKAAIKAGSKTTGLEMKKLAEKVLLSNDIMYCPHGRPVAYEIKKRELEKQFGRIQ